MRANMYTMKRNNKIHILRKKKKKKKKKKYSADTTTYFKHIDFRNLYLTLMVTRYALYAFRSAYVTSLAILAETGQTISF
ncbi:hypothetical protein HanRHA438_Chr14g0655861 [Helianthus annuus]|nr:hypothetical protein HanRHA438_Chr14g0655861 [Helianthus annuus]